MLKSRPARLAVIIALILAVSPLARGQETTGEDLKPVVTVAFSGYAALVADLNVVGELAGRPQLGQSLEMGVMFATGGQELKSLDKSKPWGAVVFTDGPEFPVLGFIPLSDLDELKAILEANSAEIEEADGKLKVTINDQTVYLKSKDGWIFVSHQAASLDSLPADPVAALGGLQEAYNLAVRVNLQNVPAMTRDALLGFVEMGMQAGMMQNPGESDEQYALRQKLTTQSFEEAKKAAGELDTIQLGLAIDEEAPSVYLDIEVAALPDTETARRLTAPKGMKTNFGGFVVPDAALSYNGVGRLEANQVEQITAMADGYRTNLYAELEGQDLPEEIETKAKRIVDEAFALLAATLKEREIDLGMLFLAGEKEATLLAATRVADGAKAEELLKLIVEEASKDAPQLTDAVKFDAAEHAGVRLHTLTIPTSQMGAPELSQLFGEELVVVVGASDKAAYLSMGTDSMERLKKVIDDSKAAKDLPPATLSLSVGPIARLVAATVPDQQAQAIAGMIAGELADAKGKDRLTIVTTIPENGQKVRIEIEEGLLKVLGVIPTIAGAMPAR